jgi:hypothetical protein
MKFGNNAKMANALMEFSNFQQLNTGICNKNVKLYGMATIHIFR